jgi:hypothetical protein
MTRQTFEFLLLAGAPAGWLLGRGLRALLARARRAFDL